MNSSPGWRMQSQSDTMSLCKATLSPVKATLSPRQSDTESLHLLPSSTPGSAHAPAPAPGRCEVDGKDGQVSYWVGYSARKPDGYFKRIDSSTVEPKGAHVLVTLSRRESDDLFGCYEYEQLLKIMLEYAGDLGLRPPSRAKVSSGSPYRNGSRVRVA